MGKVSAGATPTEFEGPILVAEGIGVTHLRYRVTKQASSTDSHAPA